jgi:CHAT domain-containing protein
MRDKWLSSAMIPQVAGGDARVERGLRALARQSNDYCPFTAPYYWGAFICQGDPAPLRAASATG